MGVQRKKATRKILPCLPLTFVYFSAHGQLDQFDGFFQYLGSERRAQPMPKLDTLECASVDPEVVTGNSSHTRTSPTATVSHAKPKSSRPLTSKQKLKRERGAELAAKLEVKASRKVIRQNNRNGAKKIYNRGHLTPLSINLKAT